VLSALAARPRQRPVAAVVVNVVVLLTGAVMVRREIAFVPSIISTLVVLLRPAVG